MPPICHDPVERLAELLAAAKEKGRRCLLGLAGAPGAGKSTLSARLLSQFAGDAVVVPMDGFHLANVQLERLGRQNRKGAPDTFDAAGYIALLQRLREPVRGETVYAPEFRREIEEPIAGAIAVADTVPLVITEGNYLLFEGAWAGVRPLLDEVWFVEPEETLRRERLLARHVAHGRTPEQAEAWVAASDDHNAAAILARRDQADQIVAVG